MNSAENTIPDILRLLQQAGVVQADQEAIELSHDSLARQIAERRSAEEKSLIRKARMVQQKFLISHANPDYLTKEQYKDIHSDLAQLERLWEREGNPEIIRYVNDSLLAINRQSQKEANIRRAKIIGVSSFFLLLLISIIIISISYFNARYSKATAIASISEMKLKADPTLSFRLAEAAFNISHDNKFARAAVVNAYLAGPFYYFFPPHDGVLMFSKFSPDGRFLASGGIGRIVRLVDVRKAMARPEVPQEAMIDLKYPEGKWFTEVWEINFDRQGRRLIACGKNNKEEGWILIWNIQGEILNEQIHGNDVYACKFSPDGRFFATGADDNTARLWQPGGGFLEVKKHDKLVADIDWSPDGKYWLSASYDGKVIVWDTTANQVLQLAGHTDNVNYARFSPDGKYILTSGKDKQVIVWDMDGNQVKRLLEHSDEVNYAEFSPDGRFVVTASYDHTAILWDWQKDVFIKLEGHNDTVFWAQFSPDGKYIITSGYDGIAIVWDLFGKPVKRLKGHALEVQYAEFSPDTTMLLVATAGKDYRVGLWNIGACLSYSCSVAHDPFDLPDPPSTAMYYAEFSNIDEVFLTAGDFNQIQLWTSRGKLLNRFAGHGARVELARFSPDGNRILAIYRDATGYMIDPESGRFTLFKKFPSEPWCLSFSPDGKSVAVGFKKQKAEPEKVIIYDVDSGNIVAEKQHELDVNSVEYSSDGSRLVTASLDHSVKVWDVLKSAPLLDIRSKNNERPNYAVFSPDGKYVISAWRDNYIRVHDMSGVLIREFKAHTDYINVLDCFENRNGEILIASAGYDAYLKVWTIDGRERMRFSDHWDSVRSVKFSRSGRFLISAAYDGTAKVWPVNLQNSPAAIIAPEKMIESVNVLNKKGIVSRLDSVAITNYGIR